MADDCGGFSPWSSGGTFQPGSTPSMFGQLVGDALVAVDAGRLAGQQVARVDLGGALRSAS